MSMANIRKGDKVELKFSQGIYEVKSVSPISRGKIQVILEKDNFRVCVTRDSAAFKHIYKAPRVDSGFKRNPIKVENYFEPTEIRNDEFDEILAEL